MHIDDKFYSHIMNCEVDPAVSTVKKFTFTVSIFDWLDSVEYCISNQHVRSGFRACLCPVAFAIARRLNRPMSIKNVICSVGLAAVSITERVDGDVMGSWVAVLQDDDPNIPEMVDIFDMNSKAAGMLFKTRKFPVEMTYEFEFEKPMSYGF